jgi:hypothetical protein
MACAAAQSVTNSRSIAQTGGGDSYPYILDIVTEFALCSFKSTYFLEVSQYDSPLQIGSRSDPFEESAALADMSGSYRWGQASKPIVPGDGTPSIPINDRKPRARLVPPEVLKSSGRQLGIANRVLDILVAEFFVPQCQGSSMSSRSFQIQPPGEFEYRPLCS